MKTLKIIYYVFLGAIALIAVLLVVSAFPITGNYKFLVVQSGSMQPEIKMGSVVAVKPSDNYKIGDIITFGEMSKTKTPTTHRIVEMRVVEGKYLYTTKGDANNAPDQNEVSQDKIIGKVLFNIPYVGYAVAEARKPVGFTILIVIPAVIIVYDEIKKIISEIKNRKAAKISDE
ncbi:signal peptidase I [Candidatus Parcubacteria bacterium]|nr:signal peptidase I [Patescibacteria group bacterium]MCG2699323.1 signal peptidase I [Candidatus Parcubacteria bacterium]